MYMPRRPAHRAALLPLVLVLLVLPATAGCGGGVEPLPRHLVVLGPWTGPEGNSFRAVLDDFEEATGIDVDYQDTAASREVLLSAVQAGDPPDIAIQPGLGELADYARQGQLIRLDEVLDKEAHERSWPAQSATRPGPYWLPVKVDLKSIVWYRGREPQGPQPDVTRWCIGVENDATSGWPGSDWIEDILLQQSGPETYSKWATGELPWASEEGDGPVLDAWRAWGEFMNGDGGAVARHALVTDFRGPDGGRGLLFAGNSCTLEHQGSFAPSLYRDAAGRADFVPSPAVLPAELGGRADGEERPAHREVAADFAAMFKDSEEARELMRHLADAETQRKWAEAPEGPIFSAHAGVTADDYPEGVRRNVVRELQGADVLCLDASDVMPPAVRRLFHEKVLEFLSAPERDPEPLLRQIDQVRRSEQQRQREQERQEELPEGTLRPQDVCG